MARVGGRAQGALRDGCYVEARALVEEYLALPGCDESTVTAALLRRIPSSADALGRVLVLNAAASAGTEVIEAEVPLARPGSAEVAAWSGACGRSGQTGPGAEEQRSLSALAGRGEACRQAAA
jgi:hypothetical protein